MDKYILKRLPTTPGVYLFRNSKKQIIYVGKAINLKHRVTSYFQKNLNSEKTLLLVSQIKNLEVIKVNSELEALLLEVNLIKKHQPFFNSQLKDGKDYLYIIFTKDDFPAVLTARKPDLEKAKFYFGPFTSSRSARTTLKIIRKILPFRTTCRPNSGRACLFYHLGLCPGVCDSKISKKDYQKILIKVKAFLEGKTEKVILGLQKEMEMFSKKLEFEKAAVAAQKIDAIKKTTQRFEEVEKYLSGPEVLDSIYEKQLFELQENLKLPKKLERIECYDISNISGTNATGSMVVLENGQVSKGEYRRFRIKHVVGSNDPAMMKEVLLRRFKNTWPLPDLLIVDGGKTQLGAALDAMKESQITLPVIGLAKKLEEVHLPGQKQTLRLPRSSRSLFLLQRIRDEAHRFAISYHRLLRSKQFLDK